ncbi:type VII secretion protein EccB [Nonomuraea sp. NPDC046570]|uniref:type VII secretion protein EccB n=1 Tax=Nonomuraea sp. NPDC046570 TaxID=3155255 RepID=UPI0033DD2B02
MQTKKDLYQAHRLMQQRLGMALLQAEPDVPETPMRRQNVAFFCGILIGVLIMAAFGIWGLLKPGGATKLEEPGQLLVEEESGAKYIYSQRERKLLPVANYVSARLLLDSPEVKVRNVSANSLDDYDRGPLIGIQGAPDSLPVREKLVKAPWSVCVVEGPDRTGGRRQYTTLVGGIDVGGAAVDRDAMVVDDGRQKWVIWADQRMRVSEKAARGLSAQPRTVPSSWLNAIPEGKDFRGPKVPGLGHKVRGPDGKVAATVGQVFTVPPVSGGAARWYVLMNDGLAQITLTQATLLLEDPAIKRAYGRRAAVPIPIDAASANASPSKQSVMGGGLPATMPRVVNPPVSAPLCSVYADTLKGSVKAKVTAGGAVRLAPPASAPSQERFDQVILPAGGAAIAGQLPGENQLGAISTYFLISDQGRRFAIQPAAELAKLGYEATDVTPIPASLVRLIPEGPALNSATALQPIQIGP